MHICHNERRNPIDFGSRGSRVKVNFGILYIKPCGHDSDYSFCPITFKLHMHIRHDERRNPVDYGSRGKRSRSTLAPCEGMPRLALSSIDLYFKTLDSADRRFDMDESTRKPVYMKNRDLQIDPTNRISDFELYESIQQKVGDRIHCIQLERDLWRVYLKDNDSRSQLISEGFEIRNITAQVYDSNPYSTGAASPNDAVLKVTVSGLPLSVDDSAVMELLGKYDVKTKSELKYEKIRHPVTHRMTSVLNGNRFLYISPLADNKSLPRNVYCAGLKCRIFHRGQNKNRPKLQCFNCWGEGHKSDDCEEEKKCRVCLQPGHAPGSELCEHYAKAKNVVAFKGKENPISNFYPCDLRVFGEMHQSAEHAFQLTKAVRSGNMEAAEKVRSAKTALDAKRIGATVRDPQDWATEKLEVMEEIVSSKAEQVPEFRSKLESVGSNAVFAEATLSAWTNFSVTLSAAVQRDLKHQNPASRTYHHMNNMIELYICMYFTCQHLKHFIL